jgi:hypothetical protein
METQQLHTNFYTQRSQLITSKLTKSVDSSGQQTKSFHPLITGKAGFHQRQTAALE